VSQCVAAYHSVLQCVTVCCSVSQCKDPQNMRCSVLQCGAVWCSVVQCVAVRCSVVQCVAVWCSVVQCGAVWCTVVHCGALWCRSEDSQDILSYTSFSADEPLILGPIRGKRCATIQHPIGVCLNFRSASIRLTSLLENVSGMRPNATHCNTLQHAATR